MMMMISVDCCYNSENAYDDESFRAAQEVVQFGGSNVTGVSDFRCVGSALNQHSFKMCMALSAINGLVCKLRSLRYDSCGMYLNRRNHIDYQVQISLNDSIQFEVVAVSPIPCRRFSIACDRSTKSVRNASLSLASEHVSPCA